MRSLYFKKPASWSKLAGMVQEEQKQRDLITQVNFHRSGINKVKEALGNKCSFLAHLIQDGNISFLAICSVAGKKQKFIVNTEVSSASELAAEDYKKLNQVLHERTRS